MEVPLPVLVFVFVLVSVSALAGVVVGDTVAGDDCPAEVVVGEVPVPTVAPAEADTSTTTDTDTAPPTTTEAVSESGSLEERLFTVETGAVVLRNGPTCLLISLGK
jgi:hypothetical protein